jgi:hypothetical protein
MQQDDKVEGIARQLALYLQAMQQLSAILDRENQLLLFERGEVEVLRDHARQEAKHALYARVETLARIVTRTLQYGSRKEALMIRDALRPLDSFRRTLRLNSALLEVCMERQQKRFKRIMDTIQWQDVGASCH